MISISSLFRDRLLYKILLPVMAVGLLVSFISIRILTPPLAASLQKQTDMALFHTSDVLISICEERFDDLIELRLDNDIEMQDAYLQEAVWQIRSLRKIHPDIENLVIRDGRNLLNPEQSFKEETLKEIVKQVQESGNTILESTLLEKKVRLLGQYYPYWELHIICYILEEDYAAPAIQARNIVIFGTFGAFFAVVVALLVVFLWRINRPLRKIISATSEIAEGNFIQTDIRGGDEIAQVGRAFNEMVHSLRNDKNRIRSMLEKLSDSEEQYRILTEDTLAYVAVLNDDKCLFVNRRMAKALGYDSGWFQENDFFSLIHQDDLPNVRKRVADLSNGGGQYNLECRLLTASAETLWVELQANRIMYKITPSVLIHAMDITAKKEEQQRSEKLELQLEQAKRLEAIGTLAGGVAHDFNNMLGGIMGAAEMLALHISEDSEMLKYQKLIIKSADRASALTEQLLTFSRTSPKTSTAVDIHAIIEETLVLVENTVDKRVILHKLLAAERSTIIGDPAQLQNMLLNLFINGAQAMTEGGDLYVSTRIEELDDQTCESSGFSLEPGSYIEIEVRDTGDGIPDEYLSRIFDPFFTTKNQEKGVRGTGLGLASAYGAVQQHNGAIYVSSTVGNGTAFRLQLPLSQFTGPVTLKLPETVTGSGCILVVDDEDIMRSTADEILATIGYEVIFADNGKHAVEVFEKERERIDLVLLDMVMPEMNGRDCFKKLRSLDPDLKIILTSGFTREEDLKDIREGGLNGFIRKPYRRAALSQIIHEVLEQD